MIIETAKVVHRTFVHRSSSAGLSDPGQTARSHGGVRVDGQAVRLTSIPANLRIEPMVASRWLLIGVRAERAA